MSKATQVYINVHKDGVVEVVRKDAGARLLIVDYLYADEHPNEEEVDRDEHGNKCFIRNYEADYEEGHEAKAEEYTLGEWSR